VRILSLTEPWASLVAVGAKRIETRSWPTKVCGPIGIHASLKMPNWAIDCLWDEAFSAPLVQAGVLTPEQVGETYKRVPAFFPRGHIIAVCELVDCFKFTPETVAAIGEPERSFGDYTLGRYGFRLANVRRLDTPVPARGALGFWHYDLEGADR
jgi:activating signal cointegrator 1